MMGGDSELRTQITGVCSVLTYLFGTSRALYDADSFSFYGINS